MKKSTVCMICYKFPPLYSGAAKQALRLCKELDKKGLAVFIVTANISKIKRKDNVEGIEVYRLPVYGNNRIQRLTFLIGLLFFLLKNCRRYDFVHIHGVNWYFIPGILLTKLLRKKSIIKTTLIGCDDFDTIRRRKLGAIQKRLFLKADAIVSINRFLTTSLEKSSSKVREIPNGVDTNEFFPLKQIEENIQVRKLMGVPLNSKIITYVGVLSYRKGIDLLIRAWLTVVQKCQNSKLLLIGPVESDNSELNEAFIQSLYKQINLSNLNDKILFLGYTQEVVRYLQASDIFVLPSRYEGMPNSLLEAMACGLACIAMNIPGTSDVITHGHDGLLFNPEDADQLSEYLLKLIEDPDYTQRLGFQARNTILKKFSLDIAAEKYVQLYKTLSRK